MNNVYKTRPFSKWMKKTDLTDQALCHAVSEMEHGLIDADLGGGLVKKRIALPGRGKNGSSRTLLATNKETKWFFLFGFEKNVRSNISNAELEALKLIAHDWLNASETIIRSMLSKGTLEEICHDYRI